MGPPQSRPHSTPPPSKRSVRQSDQPRHLQGPPPLPQVKLHITTNCTKSTSALVHHFNSGKWSNFIPTDISNTLNTSIKSLGTSVGFKDSNVSARFLRAAGTMALLCAGVNNNIIKLIICWLSDKMMRYLHVQAEPIMKNFLAVLVWHKVYNLLKSGTIKVPWY